jgi:hypothetical protein
MGMKLWTLTLTEQMYPVKLTRRVLRRKFGPKRIEEIQVSAEL